MLGNDVYFFDSIRKYIAIFGATFNDLVINRFDVNGVLTQMINVPIQYSGKEKMLTRAIQDPAISREAALVLPTMSFEWVTAEYDASRSLPASNRYFYPGGINGTSNTVQSYSYTEAPWTFMFNLYIYVKNPMDGNKILEQILPFFRPDFTVRAFMMPGQPSRDIPINLMGLHKTDEEDPNFKDRRIQIYTLSFNVIGYLWGPVREAPIINFTKTGIWAGGGPAANTLNVESFGITNDYYPLASAANAVLGFTVTTQPGLDANGNPTMNVQNSLPPNEIPANSNWDVIELIYPNPNVDPGILAVMNFAQLYPIVLF